MVLLQAKKLPCFWFQGHWTYRSTWPRQKLSGRVRSPRIQLCRWKEWMICLEYQRKEDTDTIRDLVESKLSSNMTASAPAVDGMMISDWKCSSSLASVSGPVRSSTSVSIARTRKWHGKDSTFFFFFLVLTPTWMLFYLSLSSELTRWKLFLSALSISQPSCKRALVAHIVMSLLSISGCLTCRLIAGFCSHSREWWVSLSSKMHMRRAVIEDLSKEKGTFGKLLVKWITNDVLWQWGCCTVGIAGTSW